MTLPTEPYGASAQGGTWKVTYREPAGTLEFDFELGIPKEIFWVPSESWWVQHAPAWAQGRRDEIVERAVRCAFGSGGAVVEEASWM